MQWCVVHSCLPPPFQSWFGLLVLLLVLLGLTWWLTLIGGQRSEPGGGVSPQDLEDLKHSIMSDARDYTAASRAELLQWLLGNLTQVCACVHVCVCVADCIPECRTGQLLSNHVAVETNRNVRRFNCEGLRQLQC